MSTFRYLCYRDFKSYAGRITAVHEVIELAAREFMGAADASGDAENFIATAASKHGLHVHFTQCPDIIAKTIQLHVVNVHEAFERFLDDFRRECVNVLGLDWRDYDKKSTLWVVLQNVFKSQDKAKGVIGEMQVDLCDYYRHVRNEVIHAGVQPQGLADEFANVEKYREVAPTQYQKLGRAPNTATALTRDDFNLFIRVAQDVAWALCQEARPTDEQMLASVATEVDTFRTRWPNDQSRRTKAVVALLEKRYGLSRAEADILAASFAH